MKELITQYPEVFASLIGLLCVGLGYLAMYIFNRMVISRLDKLDVMLIGLNKKIDANEAVNQQDHAAVREQIAVMSERLDTNNAITSKLVEEVGELKQDVARVDALTELFKGRKGR